MRALSKEPDRIRARARANQCISSSRERKEKARVWEDPLEASELVLLQKWGDAVRSVQGEGKHEASEGSEDQSQQSERRLSSDLSPEEPKKQGQKEQEIQSPGQAHSQKKRCRGFPRPRNPHHEPREDEDSNAVGRKIATRDDLLQEHRREHKETPQKKKRMPSLAQDLLGEEEKDGEPEEVLIGAVPKQQDEGKREHHSPWERCDGIPQIGRDVIGTSSSKQFASAEVQRIIPIAAAAHDPRIGHGIKRQEQEYEHHSRHECEAVDLMLRRQRLRRAKEVRHKKPESEGHEEVEEEAFGPRIFLHLPQRRPHQ